MPGVYIKIPKTGLGNMMLVWAYGIVFAEINQLPVTVSRWWGFRWGALLRMEKKKRIYRGYFREEPVLKRTGIQLLCFFNKTVYNPSLQKISTAESSKTFYVFDKLPANDYFINLHPYLPLIREKLFALLMPKVQEEFSQCEKPEIGVHVRRGDFKYGNHLTSLEYFGDMIQEIRKACGSELKVTVFSDAEDRELEELMKLSGTELVRHRYDITDILQFSQSRFLLLSRDSSFSYWAAFLSEGMVIMHAGDWQKRIKPDEGKYREIRYNGSKDEIEKEFRDLWKLNTR